MRLLGLVGLAVALCFLSSDLSVAESPGDSIVVIGVDSMGRAARYAIPATTYQSTLSTALTAVNSSIVPVLQNRDSSSSTAASWELNSIGVGLGLSAQFGLGPLINVTVSPQLVLVFSDSDNPDYPN